LDDLAGGGFTMLCIGAGAIAALDAAGHDVLEVLDVRVVELGAGARDVDGRTTAWLAENEVEAVLVRPDLYVYGSVRDARELPALIEDLRERLGLTAA